MNSKKRITSDERCKNVKTQLVNKNEQQRKGEKVREKGKVHCLVGLLNLTLSFSLSTSDASNQAIIFSFLSFFPEKKSY